MRGLLPAHVSKAPPLQQIQYFEHFTLILTFSNKRGADFLDMMNLMKKVPGIC